MKIVPNLPSRRGRMEIVDTVVNVMLAATFLMISITFAVVMTKFVP